MSHFLGDDDDDFVLAGVEAYNNFLFEEFCAPDPNRLIGLAQIPSLGIDVAVDALRKAKARGAKGVLISNWPSGNESLSRDDDPFWAAAVDEGIPVSIHINIISRRQRVARSARPRRSRGQPALRHDERGHARQGHRRHEPRVLDGRRQHHVDALHRRVRPLPRAAGLLDRDRRRLDPALHRVPRRPLLAQPRRGATSRSSEPPSFYWYRNNAAIVHHRPLGHRAASPGRASTT